MQTTYQESVNQKLLLSLNNAFGSRHSFEKSLISESYRYGNKGIIYLAIDHFNNFKIVRTLTNEVLDNSLYPILKINLNLVDITNFIGDLDYSELAKSYESILKLL